jgi:hypothetical protein
MPSSHRYPLPQGRVGSWLGLCGGGPEPYSLDEFDSRSLSHASSLLWELLWQGQLGPCFPEPVRTGPVRVLSIVTFPEEKLHSSVGLELGCCVWW